MRLRGLGNQELRAWALEECSKVVTEVNKLRKLYGMPTIEAPVVESTNSKTVGELEAFEYLAHKREVDKALALVARGRQRYMQERIAR